jgi:hypothetical protein
MEYVTVLHMHWLAKAVVGPRYQLSGTELADSATFWNCPLLQTPLSAAPTDQNVSSSEMATSKETQPHQDKASGSGD